MIHVTPAVQTLQECVTPPQNAWHSVELEEILALQDLEFVVLLQWVVGGESV